MNATTNILEIVFIVETAKRIRLTRSFVESSYYRRRVPYHKSKAVELRKRQALETCRLLCEYTIRLA